MNAMNINFTPSIWPEDTMPPYAKKYIECEVCSPKSRIIWGEGNPKALIVVILDNPGAREDKEGNEYVCGTRVTLQSAISQVNLTRNDIYITYLLKCRPLRSYNKEKAREFSKTFLEQQIAAINPKFIVCLGDTVVQWMFNDNEAHVKNLRGQWHNLMGCRTIVSYHPLAVRRRPNLMNQFMEDWLMLSKKYHGEQTTLYL